MPLTLKQKIFAGFAVALILSGALWWLSYRTAGATLENARWVAHTREVLEALDSVLAQLAIAEKGGPGSAGEVTRTLERVRMLTADNPVQGRELDSLSRLVAARINLPALVGIIGTMRNTEEQLLAERTSRLTAAVRRNQLLILGGGVFALLVVGFAMVQVQRDLSAREDAERRIRETEQRFRTLVDNVKDYAIYWLDPSGRIVTWNAGAERIKQYRAEEILGQHFSRFYTPEDVAAGEPERTLETAAAEGRVENEGWRVRRDGSRFWANTIVTALRDASDRLLGFAKITRDMSERRTGEESLRQHAAELEAANAELDAFAYSVSHDLRAPLRSIDGFSQALLEDYAPKLDDVAKGYLNRVRVASQRMAVLIDDLLGLSRVTRAELQRQPVNLSDLARSVMADLSARDPGRQVECVVASDVVVQGDAHLLRVVLENLIGNAWKYTRDRAEARIEFGVVTGSTDHAYYIRDNGAGFDMAYAHKLFGVFQRLHTAAEFEGTGVGLAIVQRIIRRHGGRVWAEGAVGEGATFYFTL
jgi:PAS domain S-box-containing protein